MKRVIGRGSRFVWRTARNLMCVTPTGRELLFPSSVLAQRFGAEDVGYAVEVFGSHASRLLGCGFRGADRILEVGPGRNLGTGVLMWAWNYVLTGRLVTVSLWDVFRNMVVSPQRVREAAEELRSSDALARLAHLFLGGDVCEVLGRVSSGRLSADIRYRVGTMEESDAPGADWGLIYSQAAIEHVWQIDEFWRRLIAMTASGGWHSHRIDLSDHGRRRENYLEMLEWSSVAYWMTMRYVPGGINRWRAGAHLDYIERNGLRVVEASRETRSALPGPRRRLNRRFRSLSDLELRTTGLDLVAVRRSGSEMRLADGSVGKVVGERGMR